MTKPILVVTSRYPKEVEDRVDRRLGLREISPLLLCKIPLSFVPELSAIRGRHYSPVRQTAGMR
jgi:hypothetical protein